MRFPRSVQNFILLGQSKSAALHVVPKIVVAVEKQLNNTIILRRKLVKIFRRLS